MMTPRDPRRAADIDDPTPEVVPGSRIPWWLIFLVPALLLLSLALFVLGQWDEYNPFWERTPEFREVQGLLPAIRKGALTDAEFDRALQLCETGNFHARVDAVSIVEESVKRNPERGESAARVMKRLAQSRNAKLKLAAERVLKRIENLPGVAPKPGM